MAGRPLERGGQARAAVEPARVARVAVPGPRRVAERAVQAPALRVLFQPAAQPRPLPQERLVRDLHRAVADGQQAAVGEPGDDVGVLLAETIRRRTIAPLSSSSLKRSSSVRAAAC